MRFYGGSLSEWISLPIGLVFSLLALSYRLRAEERMAFVVDAQVASPYTKGVDVRRHMRNLERMASGRVSRTGDSLADLEAIGIPVERVKVGGDG